MDPTKEPFALHRTEDAQCGRIVVDAETDPDEEVRLAVPTTAGIYEAPDGQRYIEWRVNHEGQLLAMRVPVDVTRKLIARYDGVPFDAGGRPAWELSHREPCYDERPVIDDPEPDAEPAETEG